MLKEIIIATKNKGKVKDFEVLLNDKGYQVSSLLDFPEIKDVEETGITFVENATLKAEEIAGVLNKMVIADDSGLSIDALEGRPGVYSARYAGEEKSDQANIEKVLNELEGVPTEDRTARFHCALALAIPNEKTLVVEGTCEGAITFKQEGDNGFGYDPIFFVKEQNKTMAQLTSAEKSKISHRGNALKKLEQVINDLFKEGNSK